MISRGQVELLYLPDIDGTISPSVSRHNATSSFCIPEELFPIQRRKKNKRSMKGFGLVVR
jgi:hypothetical protein